MTHTGRLVCDCLRGEGLEVGWVLSKLMDKNFFQAIKNPQQNISILNPTTYKKCKYTASNYILFQEHVSTSMNAPH